MSNTTEIFYSQVNQNLQDEVNARGRAGFKRRNTNDLNYMLTKIGNVEITAYRDQEYKTTLYSLGGNDVSAGSYVAGGAGGFLREKSWSITDSITGQTTEVTDNTYRIPPFITSAEIQTNDHSYGLLNSATIIISIPNPTRDLGFMESVFARPGRAIELKISHPNTALVNGNTYLSSDPPIRGFSKKSNSESKSKLNEVIFRGLLISFDYVYQQDSTVTLSLFLRGRSDVYTDVTLHTVKDSENNNPENITSTFYTELYNEVDAYMQNDLAYKKDPKNALKNSYTGKGKSNEDVQNRNDFNWVVLKNWNKLPQRYVALGYLVDKINRELLEKNKSFVPNIKITCNESACLSSYYEFLVSSNPNRIWLPSSATDGQIGSDVYGSVTNTPTRKWASQYKSITPDGKYPGNFYENGVGYPSRIMINLNTIDSIIKRLKTEDQSKFTVTNFFKELSSEIFSATGGAINMKLITLSQTDLDSEMLYYDTNYLGDIYKIKPYSVPMFSNHNNGTAVRDVKIESKLPQNVQALMYTINQSPTISEEMIAPFMSFMYNNINVQRTYTENGIQDVLQSAFSGDRIKEYNDQYKKFHETYKNELDVAKNNFTLQDNSPTIARLETALKKYIQYPTGNIQDSSKILSPIYPVQVEFTLDGINGFKYGDALEFDALPPRYKINTTFSIISIIHSINNTGEWTTKIRCVMRPKFK